MKWQKYNPPQEAAKLLAAAPSVVVGESLEQLIGLCCGSPEATSYEVSYEVPGKGKVVEATVAKVRNGVAANYPEPYMRRRDPDCMAIADDLPTDKTRYATRFGKPFTELRQETFDWLSGQPLIVFGFISGSKGMGADSIAIAPANAGFFAFGLALLQGMIPFDQIPADFNPKAIVYVAPPFRHTHFEGKQVVVHNRLPNLHEVFSYNLYPGPSAKKGIYSVLLDLGEKEGWVTTHCSTVQVVTPYDYTVCFMHEGASGGGKSEFLENPHREPDGRLLIGENILTKERRYIEMPRTCELFPVTDDMALCHPSIQNPSRGKLRVVDGEKSWFVRVNHINHYGTDRTLEQITLTRGKPMLFLNIEAIPNSTALLWEHTMDAPGKPCPNPRVVIPREMVPNVVAQPVTVDIRSFGVRCPPCTRENPTYGIMGIFHLLPPALAWLWRLVAPRGFGNPSIMDKDPTGGMKSEGVGSYWPFCTGLRVDQANLLLKQFTDHTRMRYILCPNQHVGAWETGFMPQWLTREYLARRGSARFKPELLLPARCSLLGYHLHQIHIEGHLIARWYTQVETQPEVGIEAYDKGAKILHDFFIKCLKDFDDAKLDPLGKDIIACCRAGGTVGDYENFIESKS